MADRLAPTAKPDIVVPDAAPPIHLASAGLLHLLHEAGGAVVVVDVVADEITRDPAEPGAAVLRDWLAAGRVPGSNRPVRVEETETGRLYAAVLEARPDDRLRDGAETAIVEWLAERIAGTDRAVIVLHENGRVPTIVRNQSLDGVERAASGDAPDAVGGRCRDRVMAGAPTANSRLQSFSQRRQPR